MVRPKMKSRDIVAKLKAKISSQLTPFIDANYWLMEIPHYDNVGDTLIWQGEMDFLHTLPFNCKRMRALDSQTQWKIEEKDLILFQGGGNFGDLWSKHHDFKMKIMKEHPNNRFIFFPQTVFFEKKENLERCASLRTRQCFLRGLERKLQEPDSAGPGHGFLHEHATVDSAVILYEETAFVEKARQRIKGHGISTGNPVHPKY